MNTPKEDFNETVGYFCSLLNETLKQKNQAYSPDSDPMANFKLAAQFTGSTMPKSVLSRMVDKFIRLGRLLDENNPADENGEALADTVLDVAGYAMLMWHAISLEKVKKKEKENNI